MGYLRFMNLFQFLPNRAFFCSSGVRAGQFPGVEAWWALSCGDQTPVDPAWETLKQDYDHPAELAFMDACRDGGLPVPRAGFELEGGDGLVIAMAEWAWPDRKLAVLLAPGDGPVFEESGWRTVHVLLDNVAMASSTLLEMWERSA